MGDSGLLLAFDFGLRRIGVALGESMLKSARPLTVIDAEANDARFATIASLIGEWQPAALVVGLPVGLDGQEHDLTHRSRRFARQLEGRFGLPVHLVDERLTSLEAEQHLRDAGQNWQRRKANVDAEAAAIILQSYFDAS